MTPRYFDIHSHVNFKDYDADLPEVLGRMEGEGVATITVGVDKKTSEQAVAFAETHEHFYATLGLHPTDTRMETFASSEYKELAKSPKMLAVGECGVDYFRIEGDLVTEKKRQWREFEKQFEFAVEIGKPLMIHCRPSKGSQDAYLDMLSYLEPRVRANAAVRGNMHFFVGNLETAKRFWSIGFTTSFTGVLTFTHDYDEVVAAAPLGMLLTETDSPFAAPAPFRGRRNEPVYVKYVVSAMARIRGVEEEVIRDAVLMNAYRLFGLK
jgi:TatD DNase family protein